MYKAHEVSGFLVRPPLQIRNQRFDFGQRTFVMGVINATPDSFSGDGCVSVESIVNRADELINHGADILDIGGQSTRPGYIPVEQDAELARVLPAIKAVREFSDIVISVDTTSPAVLELALKAGADMLNSIWGLTDQLHLVVSHYRCPVILMHNQNGFDYPSGLTNEVCKYLLAHAQSAEAVGLRREQIILDPGIGFGKTADQNIEILSHLHEITSLGYPCLIGTSRKSTIGKLTGRATEDRVLGTAATVALGIANGVDLVRVHDVKSIVDCVRVSDAIVRNWRPNTWGQN